MTINATASILLAMYIVLGEEHGVSRDRLPGAVQSDILREFIARGTYIYPIEPSLRLAIDVCRFVHAEGMTFNPISISGYHMREAGATAVQEVAFTFANGLEYVRRAVALGLDVNELAARLSFFFAAFTDLFEEVAKFRAARRLWARLMKENFGAADSACRLRFHADRRLDAHRAAAQEQRRASGDPGAGGRAGWHSVAPHQCVRRGVGAAHRAERYARAPHAAAARP